MEDIYCAYVSEDEAIFGYPPERYEEVVGTYEVRYQEGEGESLLARTKTPEECLARADHFRSERAAGRLLRPDESAYA